VPTEYQKTEAKNPHRPSVVSGGWLGPNDLKAGYYWCRIGTTDAAPTIVKIDGQQSPDELALWEFECGEWESLRAYGPSWQFLPVSCPNIGSQRTRPLVSENQNAEAPTTEPRPGSP
jgi:hypothetical protein